MKVSAEIVNGKCPTCDEYTMLVGLTKEFFRCIVSIYLSKDRRSWNYLSIWKHILKNLIFINVYLSPFHYLFMRVKRIFKF